MGWGKQTKFKCKTVIGIVGKEEEEYEDRPV